MAIGGLIGWGMTYMWANYRYNNKKEIDKCYDDRNNLTQENTILKNDLDSFQEQIKGLKKDLESSYREIAEKNKYLSEDKVIVERLSEVKQLSNKMASILIDYDKETIQHLLTEYAGKEEVFDEENDDNEQEHHQNNEHKKW